MSDNSHIDKIFKEGLGERNFANADAMWQNMEAELDKEAGIKKRPFIIFGIIAGLLTAGFFVVQLSNTPAATIAEGKTQPQQEIQKGNQIAIPENKEQDAVNAVSNSNTTISLDNPMPSFEKAVSSKQRPAQHISTANKALYSMNNVAAEEEAVSPSEEIMAFENSPSSLTERMYAQADLIGPINNKTKATITAPAPLFKTITAAKNTKTTAAVVKKHTEKPSRITIEAVGGGDFLRMNRKAGYYVGVRINKLLDKGTVISTGLNYTSHTVQDYYRIYNKPSNQRRADANLSNIKTLRVPIYIQREMGKSKKLALMAGLVPTYITHAEVSNVPDSYVGNPDPLRRFTIQDLHRFNMLFGAGIKYSPVKWVSFEISGSYGLTGMVKDAYKNQSRVNDNFKSLQAGLAFRLK